MRFLSCGKGALYAWSPPPASQLIACFYFETLRRNSPVVARCLTWQMARERRSSRLSLSVRWSIPVPIVFLRFTPWRQPRDDRPKLTVGPLVSARAASRTSRLDTYLHPVPLHPKRGLVFFFFFFPPVCLFFVVVVVVSRWRDFIHRRKQAMS